MSAPTRFRTEDIPLSMRDRPLDRRGFPVPWFVDQIDGEWDFRVIRPGGIQVALHQERCWLCGKPLGRLRVFAVGPMSIVNRITSEPPSHPECVRFAAVACPFLSNPKAKRPDVPVPANVTVAGEMLLHNPGATALWATTRRKFDLLHTGPTFEFLIRLPRPEWVEWWADGLLADRERVTSAMKRGLPLLTSRAADKGPEAIAELDRMVADAEQYLPRAA